MASADKPSVRDAVWGIIKRAAQTIAGIRVGEVVAYNPATNTASVQPVRHRFIFGQPQPEQLIVGAPVGWWRFGGMVLVGDLEVGDQVLVVNFERSIAEWWTTGLAGPSTSERMHNPGDVMILPWIASLAPSVSAHGGPAIRVPGTFRMGRADNLAGLTMFPALEGPPGLVVELEGGPAGIKAGKTAVSFALKGTEIAAACGTPLIPGSIAFILAAVPPSTSPDPATVTAVAGNKAAILALCGALFGNLTVKLVVE